MSPAPSPDPSAPLLAAREVSLYLLSLLAVAGARIAWLPVSAGMLFGQALLLALAGFFGTLLAEVLTGSWTSASRRRNRLIFLAGYGGLAFIALTAALSGGEIVAQEAAAFGLLHSGLLLVAPAAGLDMAVLGNALLLVILTSLRGGTPAAVATTGFIGLAGFFLAFDHAARKLQEWPRARARLLGPITRDAARLLLPAVVGLALFFSVAPPTPYARGSIDHGARPAGDASGSYQWLALLALGGGGLMLLLGRLLRARGGEDTPLVEVIDSHQAVDEPLQPPVGDEGVYGTPRARVVRAYVRFLARARDQGWKLPSHQTPREIQARLRAPARDLDRLTVLFMDARYGPADPVEGDVRDAESASRALVGSLGARRR